MAEALPKVAAPADPLTSIIQLFTGLGPLFGSGKQTGTSTTTSTIDPAVSGQADQLIAAIMGQNDSPYLNDLITNIMDRAKQSFVPILGQSVTSGNRAYSDTTVKQLANEAMARATGEAADAKLKFIQGNNSTAGNLVGQKIANSTTRTGTTTAKTAASPAGKALQLGSAALGAYGLYKKATKKDSEGASLVGDISKGAQGIYDSIFGGSSGAGISDISSLFSAGGAPSFSAAVSPLTNFADSIDTISPFILSDGASSLLSAGDTITSGASLFGDIANEAFSGSSLFSGAADLGTSAAFDTGTSLAGDVAGNVLGSGLGPFTAAADVITGGDFGSFVGDIVGGDFSVICTELYRQGIMSRELYKTDIEFAQSNLSPTTLRGYRFWAVPFVRLMRKSKLLTKVAAFFALRRALSLTRNSTFGSCFRRLFEPVCWVIGNFVPEVNYKKLYVQSQES